MSKLTDYGVVLMACIAEGGKGSIYTASELAAMSHVPQPMVSKILKELTKGGLLISHRGPKGGYSLAQDAEEITLAEIITLLEGPIALTECVIPSLSECNVERLCPLRGGWQLINTTIKNALDGVNLSDMARYFRMPEDLAAIAQLPGAFQGRSDEGGARRPSGELGTTRLPS